MSESASSEFIASLPAWSRFFDGFEMPPALAGEQALRELRLRLLNLRRRLRDGPLAPLRMAFFGPTGAGKSKLFGSLIGRNLSGSGYKRPFTRRSFYYVHDSWQSLVAAMQGQVELHHEPSWRDVIVVDTPDFDSVELSNRDEAERVFLEADHFLFVTDSLKYADASTWDYLARIRSARKNFVVILNKVNSDTIPASFDSRFRDTFQLTSSEPLPYTTVTVPELPIGDDELIQHGSIDTLRIQAASLIGETPADRSVERFRGELDGIFERAQELLEEVQTRRQQIQGLAQRLETRHRESIDRLEYRLSEGLEPAVRNEVYQRVMKRLDSIDLLRYPRKIISYPINGLRSLWRSWTGSKPDDDPSAEASDAIDPVTTETFHMLESEIIRYADESRLDFIQQPGWERLLTRDTFRELRMEHEAIQEKFRQQHARFRDWVESHARDTAARITGENKFTFILSQVLFHTVLITAQIKTGGGFTLLEAGFDGVVSPFVAKAVSIAIGNEKVKKFEADAHQEHQQLLAEILDIGRQRFHEFLAKSSEGLTELESQLQNILSHQTEADQLVNQFASESLPSPADREDH